MINLNKLQHWLKENYIDVFIITRTDEFLSEYIAPYAERLKWISKFSGSAGKAIIMQNTAGIFVDGRYTVQIQQEVNKNDFIIKHIKEFEKWFKKYLRKNYVIGLDPNLHSKTEIVNIKKITDDVEAKIKFLEFNPIDLLWFDQPSHPKSKAFIQKLQYSGKTTQEKISQIRSTLKSNQCDYIF